MIRFFHPPKPADKFALGADPAQGLSYGDDSTFCVINRRTGQQCAEYQGKIDPLEFGDLINMAGRYYNNAYVGVENVSDLSPVLYLREAEYPSLHYQCVIDGRVYDKHTDKIGWNTNSRTRRILRNDALAALKTGAVTICSAYLLDQMEVFARNQRGKWEAIPGASDDLVFAFMIAVQMMKWAEVVDDWKARGYIVPTEDEAKVMFAAAQAEEDAEAERDYSRVAGDLFDSHIERKQKAREEGDMMGMDIEVGAKP